jgi:hypothetical protein
MSTMDDFLLEDLVDDHLAVHVMYLRSAALRAEYKNTETITATKELTDNDTPFQMITASGSSRTVELAPEATTNHVTVVYNAGGSQNVVVKDDSGGTTFATLEPGEWCLAIPMGGSTWKVIDSNALVAVSAASDTVAGIVELATAAETTTGTDATRAVTPDGLAGSNYGKRVVGLQVVASGVNVATGDAKAFFRVPSVMNGWNLVDVAMCCYTAGTTGTMDVQIRNKTDSVDMLSTKLTIDSGETDTATAATAAVIDATKDDVATGDQICIDVDAIQTTPAQGLYVELIFQLP